MKNRKKVKKREEFDYVCQVCEVFYRCNGLAYKKGLESERRLFFFLNFLGFIFITSDGASGSSWQSGLNSKPLEREIVRVGSLLGLPVIH